MLVQVQSELPVCTPAIVNVLLHRLAIVRPGKEVRAEICENAMREMDMNFEHGGYL